MQISQRAIDLCIRHEVTSKAYYEKHYQRPEWPGLQSGVTVGIGYDLGQASAQKIKEDWQEHVPADMLFLMMSCSGHTGSAGKAKLAEVRSKILIPWAAAMHVFANRDVPQWTAGVLKKVPNSNRLSPTCLGVLFDLAYNRGHSWSMAGERYKEMRGIKAAVQSGQLGLVPGHIREMKRLWPNTKGLLRRCDDRAELWLWALRNETRDSPAVIVAPTPPAPAPDVPQNAGPARSKPPATTAAQNTTAVVIAAGGAGAAKQAHDTGLAGGATAIGIALAAALVAAVVWYVWFRNRNPE